MKLLLVLFLSINVWATDSKLENIDVKFEDGAFIGRLDFSDDIDSSDVSVDFINETVQFDIPQAVIPEGKKFTPLKHELVKSLYTYQLPNGKLRFRVIYKDGQSASQFEEAVSVTGDGKSLFLRIQEPNPNAQIDFTTLSGVIKSTELANKTVTDEAIIKAASEEREALAESPKKKADSEDNEKRSKIGSIDDIEAETPLTAKKEAKALLSEKDIPVLTPKKAEEKKIENPIYRMLASLGVVLAVIGGLILAFRKYSRRNPLNKKAAAIKVLSQHHIGPKRTLAIIQVAGESILIGMTDHSINHIKTLALLDEEVPDVSHDSRFDAALNDVDMLDDAEDRSGFIDDDTDERDEFSMAGIKDLVSGKLKGYKDI